MALVIQADSSRTFPLKNDSVDCVVTSPPYWGLRDYGVDGQLGLEPTPYEYVENMIAVFREVQRVLKPSGSLWLNLGDSYASAQPNRGPIDGLKPKDLVGVPWRVAFALQADGWWLRNDEIWCKPNPMPESTRDRATRAHEYIFHLTKAKRYYYDYEAARETSDAPIHDTIEARKKRAKWDAKSAPSNDPNGKNGIRPKNDKQRGHSRRHAGFNERWDSMTKQAQAVSGRNRRSWRTVATRPFPGAHYAVFPPDLIKPHILSTCPVGGIVLDPFAGSGTTIYTANQMGRRGIGLELSWDYCEMAKKSIGNEQMALI